MAQESRGHWLRAARTYLAVIGVGNLLWEAVQFPLYTIWYEGTRGHILLALIHGTVGDLFISAAALMASIVIFGDQRWPAHAFWRVGIPTILLGLGYTVYSEWINVEVRHTWAYAELMPRLPPLGTGLSPVLEWIVVPVLALIVTRRDAGG
ncbi:MAG: hypothetical protein HY659_03500 [Rhizobiales bacterium]|nr:hypothetical protein [Hyphomicrobiales bacterium]